MPTLGDYFDQKQIAYIKLGQNYSIDMTHEVLKDERGHLLIKLTGKQEYYLSMFPSQLSEFLSSIERTDLKNIALSCKVISKIIDDNVRLFLVKK